MYVYACGVGRDLDLNDKKYCLKVIIIKAIQCQYMNKMTNGKQTYVNLETQFTTELVLRSLRNKQVNTFRYQIYFTIGLSWWLRWLSICLQCRRPGLGRSPGEGNGNSLQYSCLENPIDLIGYSPWGHKESDLTE